MCIRDRLTGISVTDAEDGDLTSNIKMETDYIEGSTGIFNVNCSVIDLSLIHIFP